MNIGDLTHLVILQQPTGRADGYGESADQFNDSKELYISLKPLTYSERDRAGGIERSGTHKISCYYDPDITGECQFKYGDRIFDIFEIINVDEANFEYAIRANEVLSAATDL